jgi:peptidoglycan/xylan/chitin deacetylase (PgdA/CDA1 family)
VAALTFDDGPSAAYTPRILRILAAARAPASFEIIGRQAAAYRGILRAENAAGMALVNHTWTHADLALLPARRWPAEVDRTSALLQGVTGHPVRCLRPPYGLGDRAVDVQLRARGLAELDWDVDPSDYLRPGAGLIARRVLAALHPGAIMIMHDGGGNRAQTVAALPAIIRGIRAAGYHIVPVCAAGATRPASSDPLRQKAPAAHPGPDLACQRRHPALPDRESRPALAGTRGPPPGPCGPGRRCGLLAGRVPGRHQGVQGLVQGAGRR